MLHVSLVFGIKSTTSKYNSTALAQNKWCTKRQIEVLWVMHVFSPQEQFVLHAHNQCSNHFIPTRLVHNPFSTPNPQIPILFLEILFDLNNISLLKKRIPFDLDPFSNPF